MKKVLIAVDDTRNATGVMSTFYNLIQLPDEVILVHVQRLEGKSLMIDMLGEAELSTLKESINGTEHKEQLDTKAWKILDYYTKELKGSGLSNVKTVVRDGQPVDEILKVAEMEGVDLIILGYVETKGLNRLITGSIVRDIKKRSKVPVVLAKRPSICEEPYSWRDAYYAMSLFTVVVLVLFFLGIVLGKSGTLLH